LPNEGCPTELGKYCQLSVMQCDFIDEGLPTPTAAFQTLGKQMILTFLSSQTEGIWERMCHNQIKWNLQHKTLAFIAILS
jgi:hypothetical protein